MRKLLSTLCVFQFYTEYLKSFPLFLFEWYWSIATFRIMVKGYLFRTAAFPLLRSRRASPGWIVFNGCLLVSTTKTFLMFAPFGTSGCPGNGGLDNVQSGFSLQALALTL